MVCFVIESKRCREFRDASKKVVAFFGVFFYAKWMMSHNFPIMKGRVKNV